MSVVVASLCTYSHLCRS